MVGVFVGVSVLVGVMVDVLVMVFVGVFVIVGVIDGVGVCGLTEVACGGYGLIRGFEVDYLLV